MNSEVDQRVTFSSFKQHVYHSLYLLFGEVGSSTTVELLKYYQSEKRAILSVPEDFFVRLYSALTLNGVFNGIECAYRVHKTTRDLLDIDPELTDPTLQGMDLFQFLN